MPMQMQIMVLMQLLGCWRCLLHAPQHVPGGLPCAGWMSLWSCPAVHWHPLVLGCMLAQLVWLLGSAAVYM